MLKQRLKNFFLRDPSNWKFWVLAAFICKGLIFIFLLCRNLESPVEGFRGIIAGDTWSYFAPIDNLISRGIYLPDYRMPGYGIFYMPLALLFKTPVAYTILIIFQFIAASLSVYPLARIANYVFKSASMFYLTFYLFAFSIYTNLFDTTLQTESFAVSFLILSVFFFLKAINHAPKRNFNLVLSGLLLTEVIFLRPVFMPLLLLFSIILLISFFKQGMMKKSFSKMLLFLLPFLVFDGAWMVRNFIKYDKVIPATAAVYFPKFGNSYYAPLWKLVRSWGGSDQHWDPDAEIRWFGMNDGLQPQLHDVKVSLPGYIYTSKFNYDSLLVLRKQLSVYISKEQDTVAVNSPEMKSLLATIRGKCLLYASSIKEEKPVLFYVWAPLIRTKVFLIHSGTYALFRTLTSQLNPVAYGFKLFYSLFYLFVIGFGTLGIFLLVRESLWFNAYTLVTGIVLFTILIHPVILGMCEKRYFLPAYPFMIICASHALLWVRIKFGGRTRN